MNRILLKECLDELRSDDLEELTEAHNHRSKHKKHPGRKRRQTQKKVGAGPNYAHRHSGSSKPTSRNQSNRKPTTGIDSKTGQELASLAETIAQEGAKSPEDFLNELSTRCGRPMAVADNSKYFTNTNTGVNLRLRLANHRGSAEWFFVNGHPRNNFGIVIKTEPKRFVPDKRVQYREEIFFKDDLDTEMEIGIVKGLMNWVATGRYNGPLGNETATSPDGRVVLNRRPRNRLAPNPQQPTTPPASPPTGPGVLESLAAKYFKEAHSMKYRLLKEAALRELMEEDYSSFADIPNDIFTDTIEAKRARQEDEMWKQHQPSHQLGEIDRDIRNAPDYDESTDLRFGFDSSDEWWDDSDEIWGRGKRFAKRYEPTDKEVAISLAKHADGRSFRRRNPSDRRLADQMIEEDPTPSDNPHDYERELMNSVKLHKNDVGEDAVYHRWASAPGEPAPRGYEWVGKLPSGDDVRRRLRSNNKWKDAEEWLKRRKSQE